MEATLANLCSRLGLPNTLVETGLQYQRTLQAKQASLGVSSTYQGVVCLHLAASQFGQASVDVKEMVKVAGAKSKPHYNSTFDTAQKILELDQVLSVQEVCIRLGVSNLVKTTGKVLEIYETHLKNSYGESRVEGMNFGKPIYPCAAIGASCKMTGEKVDMSKLVELSRSKKKDLVELVEQIFSVQPDKEGMKGKGKQQDFMDKIMGTGEDMETDVDPEVKKAARDKIKEDDFEDDGFEDWKQEILRKAVEQGFSRYKKYLTA